jgi:hypothetical protein
MINECKIFFNFYRNNKKYGLEIQSKSLINKSKPVSEDQKIDYVTLGKNENSPIK